LPIDEPVTLMENAGSATLAVPSLTLMTMFEVVPTFAEVGVPESWPVEALNVAHVGRFAIENVSVSPFASEAVGRKLYAVPAATLVVGVPEIVGGSFGRGFTVSVKGASEAVAWPSLTLIAMPENEPAPVGVPLRRPVEVLNVAQVGRFWMLKPSVLPSGSLAVGWNAYGWPTVTVVIGEPLMTGARFAATCTLMANALNEALPP
jgi:hypothetical protein